jgi:phage FluMu protein Com
MQDLAPRCWRCGKLLAELLTRPWRIRCPRCRALNGTAPPPGPRRPPPPVPGRL